MFVSETFYYFALGIRINKKSFNLEQIKIKMQSKQNSDIDARTFPQIWETLTPAEQGELRFQLTRNGDCSRVTVYNWSKGMCPASIGLRKKAASTMGKFLGKNVSHITLFPIR